MCYCLPKISCGLLLVIVSWTAAVPAQEVEEAAATNEKIILDNQAGYWRVRVCWKTPVMVADSGDVKPLLERPRRGQTEPLEPVPVRRSPHPTADWCEPDFDDSAWPRTRRLFPGPNFRLGRTIWHEGNPAQVNVILARGRFVVEDPTRTTGLQLSVAYHGGLVVYLNGREIARSHLPKGKLGFDSLADAYPKEAYLQPDGKKLNEWEAADRYQRSKLEPAILERYAMRVRRITDVELPASLLCKGCNVLAFEVHRAPVRELFLGGSFGGKRHYRGDPSPWAHAALVGVRLMADSDAAVVPNVDRPDGVQVWTRNATASKVEVTEYADPREPIRPIRIVAARNGVFSGQAVVGSKQPIVGLQAAVSDLQGPGQRIPTARIELAYPRLDGPANRWDRWPPTFDSLVPEPPERVELEEKSQAAVQPVWVRVRIPADAKPGKYLGRLTISTESLAAVTVPIELSVHDFRLPDPSGAKTFVDMIQSPETLAIHYDVSLWSDEHFRYIEKSLRLMAELGNKTVYLPLITKTHFGNTQSMVRFVKLSDGSYRRDYSVLDRYMDLVERTQGKPQVVVLYCWERYTARDLAPPMVTAIDSNTGNVTEIETPKYNTPQGAAFWKPVFDELRERFARRGLEHALMIGAFGDFNTPNEEQVQTLKQLTGGMPWVAQGHGRAREIHDEPVGYCTTVWGAFGPSDPREKRLYGWRGEKLACQFSRDMFANAPLPEYRQLLEWNIAGSQRGIGRVGADFWEVLGEDQKSHRGGYSGGGRLAHRFPELGKWGQLVVRTNMVNPGRDGAVSTVRFEALREGLQDSEARIFIERALLDETARAKLGDDLARRAQQVLDERTLILANRHYTAPWFFSDGYYERTDRLLSLAAEVAKAVKSP